MTDRIAGSAPGNGSRAAVGEDLVGETNCRLRVKNFMTQDGTNGTRKMKRYTSVSETSDLESTATSCIKRSRIEVNHALLEEIREMNQQMNQQHYEQENEDLSIKAKSRFSISLRNLSQPMSLGAITRTWDVCARAVISNPRHSRAAEAHSPQRMELGRTVRVLVSNFSMRI